MKKQIKKSCLESQDKHSSTHRIPAYLKRQLVLTCMLLLLGLNSICASHLSGGEITYEYFGNNQYKVRMTLVGDCTGEPLGTVLNAFLFVSGGNLTNPAPVAMTSISSTVVDALKPSCPYLECSSSLNNPEGHPSFHVIRYESQLITIPLSANPYTFYFANNARNSNGSTFANLVNNGDNSFIYFESTLNNLNTASGQHSSLSFDVNYPPIIEVPNQTDFTYDFHVIPVAGTTFTCNWTNALNLMTGISHTSSIYNAPYTASYQFSGMAGTNTPSLSVSNNGATMRCYTNYPNITTNSNGVAQAVAGYAVATVLFEQLNASGVVIGTIHREMEIRAYARPEPSGIFPNSLNVSNVTITHCPQDAFSFQITDLNFDDFYDDGGLINQNQTATIGAGAPAGTSITSTGTGSNSNGVYNVNIPMLSPGTYNIPVTITNSQCPFSSSKTNTYQVIIEGPVTGITTSSVCTSPITLTATTPSYFSGINYTWTSNPAGTNITTTANSITVTPTNGSSITYTVSATDGNNCNSSASKIVVVGATATISPSTISTCPSVPTSLTATGGGSYLWSTGATSAVTTVTPTSSTTYNVSVTATNGCTATASRSVTIDADCCPAQAGYIFLNGSTSGTNISTFSQFSNPGTYTGLSIQVNKTIIINGNYTFTNCTFKMNPGAEIIVNGTRTLTLNGGNYSGVCKLWKGITVQTNGILSLNNSVTLSDALYAVEMKANSTVNSNDASFINNIVGIYKAGSTSNNPELINFTTLKSSFSKTGSLLTPYSGCPNIPIRYSSGAMTQISTTTPTAYAGILMSNVSTSNATLTLGTDNTSFNGLVNGIVVIKHSGDINIEGADFNNIASSDLGQLFGNGVYIDGILPNLSSIGIITSSFTTCNRAISVRRATIQKTNTSNNSGILACNISNCKLGILASTIADVVININNNTITTPTVVTSPVAGTTNFIGISIESCTNSDVDISNNTISATGNAIRLQNNAPLSSCVIYQNTITNTNTDVNVTPTSILVSQGSIYTGTDNNVGITNNSINLNQLGYQGISVINTPSVSITSNTIVMRDERSTINGTTTITPSGIILESSNGARVNCNQISFILSLPNNTPAFNSAQGISVVNSTNTWLTRNITDFTRTGIYFSGACNNSLLRGNDISHHVWGLWMNATAILGPQDYLANTWWSVSFPSYNYGVVNGIQSAAVRFDGTNSNAALSVFKTATSVTPISQHTFRPPTFAFTGGAALSTIFPTTPSSTSVWPSNSSWSGCTDIINRPQEDTNTSIEEQFYSNIRIYPNPTSDIFNIEGNVSSTSLYNLTGQLLLNTTDKQLSLVDMPQGMYIVLCYDANGIIVHQEKVVKQ